MHLDLTLHTMPRLGGHGRKPCPFPRRSTWQWTQAKLLGERFVQVPLGSFALVGVRLHYVIQTLPDEGSTTSPRFLHPRTTELQEITFLRSCFSFVYSFFEGEENEVELI